jgi:hypothetical protein|tara:strand:- start:203 stop:1174 length:972 start_codon:yes stop_codon:yes gene_type:complete
MSYDENNPNHRKELEAYLTRPKATQEEARATWNKRESEFNEDRKQKLKADKDIGNKSIIDQVVAYSPKPVQPYIPGLEPITTKHIADTLNKFEDPDFTAQELEDFKAPIKKQDPMINYVKNNNANNKNPGTFKKLVEKDERDFKDQRGKRFINKTLKPVERNDNPKGVAFNPTTQLFTNKDRTIAFKTYDEADTWNKAIGINTEPKPYPTQATPEMVGALATRLERNAQMSGGKGPFTKIADNLGKKKPIIKKPFKPTATNYSSFKIDPVLPIDFFKPSKPDPQLMELQRRVEDSSRRSREEKIREANSGLGGLIGGVQFDNE